MSGIWSIRERVARLAALDQRHQAPGARRHRYEFGSKLSEADLDAWERENGVSLPTDLRAFYTVCGDGGPGPLNGMRCLSSVRLRAGLNGAAPLIEAVATGQAVALCLDGDGSVVELPDDGRGSAGPFLAFYERWLDQETRRFETIERLFPTSRSLDELYAQAEAALGKFPVADYFTSVVRAQRPEKLFGEEDEIRDWKVQRNWYEDQFRRYKARYQFHAGTAGGFMKSFPRKRVAKG
ncbi:MAG: SMI1/KNR4 family protein [Pseudomonadota bacterium]